MSEIEQQAKMIEGLAATMREGMWASELLDRCRLISDALTVIRREAQKRQGGER